MSAKNADDGPDDYEEIGEDNVNRRMLRLDGEVKSLSEWARLYGHTKANLCNRLKYGWSIERAITTPTNAKMRTARVMREVRKQFDPEQSKPDPKTPADQIRLTAAKIKERLKGLSALEQLLQLQREFGEKKFQACKRLKAERRLSEFEQRKRVYAAATKNLHLSKHLIFYLALADFTPLVPKG